MRYLRRLRFVFRNFRHYPQELNRRAGVEQQLWDCVHGKRPMPDRDQLATWARELGIPRDFRRSA